LLEHHPDAGGLFDGFALYEDGTLGGALQAGDVAENGAFAGAGGAEDNDELALCGLVFHQQVEPVDDEVLTAVVGLPDAAELDDVFLV
jgi:hypothetical protein